MQPKDGKEMDQEDKEWTPRTGVLALATRLGVSAKHATASWTPRTGVLALATRIAAAAASSLAVVDSTYRQVIPNVPASLAVGKQCLRSLPVARDQAVLDIPRLGAGH